MSVVEQRSASQSDHETGVPEFPAALRGYDRQQVDVYVQDLTIRLTAERRRAEQAERAAAQLRAQVASLRNPQPPTFEHLGAEAGRILEQAGSSARMLVDEATNRGRAIVEDAEAQAAELIERAERRAAEREAEAAAVLDQAASEKERVLDAASQSVDDARARAEAEVRAALRDAHEAAERTRQQAMTAQVAVQAETERLREARDRMLDYLGRIHSDLGELLAEAVQLDAELNARDDGHAAPKSEEGEEGEEGDDAEDAEDDDSEDEETATRAVSSGRAATE